VLGIYIVPFMSVATWGRTVQKQKRTSHKHFHFL